eukprot:26114_1
MFSTVFNQVGTVLSLYLPVRTIQDLIASGIIKGCNELLTSTLRYQLYTDLDQMRERLNQFKQSNEYFQSMPDHVTTYQIWDIILYDSFNDDEQKQIESTNILDIVSMEKILTFCLLPQAEYFTTVQSKHDGMVQKINIWTKPLQVNKYMSEIIDTYNVTQKYNDDEKYANNNELFEFKHAATRTWRTICHGAWSDTSIDGILNKCKAYKSTFEKAKYYDWRPDNIASFDVEFCNYYYDDNDKLIGNYYKELRDILCVSDFIGYNEDNKDKSDDIIKRWYAIDIETKNISSRLIIMNSNLLCGLLNMEKTIVLKKRNEDISEELEMMNEAAQKNKERRNVRIDYSERKRHIVMYKFKFIVFKGRYKLKDEINSELAELEWLNKTDNVAGDD